MKLIPFFLFVFLGSTAFCQSHDVIMGALQSTPQIVVEEQQLSFRNEVKPAFTVKLYCDGDAFEKEFRTFLKTRYAIEEKKSSGYFEARNTLIEDWHTDSISISNKMQKDGDAIRFILHVESRGQFISQSTHPESSQKISSGVRAFAREFYLKYYDQLIEEQQRNYDRHVRDMKKLAASGSKLSRQIESVRKQITNAENTTSSLKSKIKDNENKANLLKQELDQVRSESEQAKKELDANVAQVNAKQKEYDTFNYKGELDSKEAKRTIKDLEKLRSQQENLQSRVTNNQKSVAAKENDILDNSRSKTELESEVRDLENSIDKRKNEINSLEKDVSTNESSKADKQSLIDSSRIVLDKLKNAKAGLVAQQ